MTEGNLVAPALNTIVCADVIEYLRGLPSDFVNCVVTSPPYWGLRDYGVDGQIGLEPTVAEYVAKMVEVFGEVRRVLRDDGVLWLNLGDCYAGSWGAQGRGDEPIDSLSSAQITAHPRHKTNTGSKFRTGLPAKNLVGVPWLVAFALQCDGWFLRRDVIWSKPNPMPESVTDRPTSAHEYVFMLTKSGRYFYDADAVREPATCGDHPRNTDCRYVAPSQTEHTGLRKRGLSDKQRGHYRRHAGFNERWDFMSRAEQRENGRNLRSVWTIAPKPFYGAHFATFPEELVKRCILAACPADGVVLDPFMGSGTTAVVATALQRAWLGCELNPEYVAMAARRLAKEVGLLLSPGRSETVEDVT